MKRYLCIVLLILCCIFAMVSCTNNKIEKDEMFALDTIIEIDLYNFEGESQEVFSSIKERIKTLENEFSINGNGDVYKINNSSGQIDVSSETLDLLNKSIEISDKTNGLFDITIYPIMHLWGFDTGEYIVPNESEIKSTLSLVDYTNVRIIDNKVEIINDSKIDFGAIGKGFISEEIVNILNENGVKSAIVNCGGNVFVLGTKENNELYTVGIADPQNANNYIGKIKLSNKFSITSGAYQRFFEKDGVIYHHIMNPKTGYPSKSDIMSITIIGDDGAQCDAYSTALYIMGIDKAINFYQNNKNFDFVILSNDGKSVYISENITDFIEFENKYNINVVE